MRYEMMFPEQIRNALSKQIPVVLPAGVLEYHGEHLVLGVDTILIVKALEEIEKEMEIVILPPLFYGAASYAVEKPEKKGTIHVPAHSLYQLAHPIFYNLLRVGFRNIHTFIHHQSENFSDGMPTDLALKLAAKQAIFDFLEKNFGEDWWGRKASNYYSQHETQSNPFNWIKIHPFMNAETQRLFPIDHAGKQETSLMMAFCPEGINMKKKGLKKWYTKSAEEAALDYGMAAKKMILCEIKKILAR